jgi:hypothetical protein
VLRGVKRLAFLCGCLAAVVIAVGPLAAGASAADEASMTAAGDAAPESEEEAECKEKYARSINEQAHPASVSIPDPIELTVHATDPVLSFGAGRGIKSDYIVLKASSPIPEKVFSTNFEIDSLEPLRRIGSESLESVRLVSPTYTRPHFFNHRKEIGFNLCIDGAHGEPGTYTGQFLFVGPGEISSAVLTQTAQMKSTKGKFAIFLILVLLATFVFLCVRAYAELGPNTSGRELTIKIFLLLVSVAAAGLAMALVYAKSATWGENQVVSVAALIATAFTAVGLGNTLSGGTEKISLTLQKAKTNRQHLKQSSQEHS